MYTFACSTVHIGWVLISVKYQQVVFILFARVHMQLYSKGKASKLDKMFFFKLKLTVHWQSGYINLISGLIAVYNVDIHVCKKKPFFLYILSNIIHRRSQSCVFKSAYYRYKGKSILFSHGDVIFIYAG